MRFYHLGLALGLVCLNGSIPLALIFSSGELLIGMLLAGPTFIIWGARWERFRDGDPAFDSAMNINLINITVLSAASILNLSAGILGAIFKPGFHGWYAASFATGLVLMFAAMFLTIISSTIGSRRAHRLAQAQQLVSRSGTNVKMKRCGVCGENISTSEYYDPIKPHIGNAHPEYSRLLQQYRKVLLASGGLGSILLIFADYSAITTNNDLLLLAANGAFVLYWIITVLTYSGKLRGLKRRWKLEHQQS